MSERRRAEIEAKRAKLAELRKAKADRMREDAERKAQNDVRRSICTVATASSDLCSWYLTGSSLFARATRRR